MLIGYMLDLFFYLYFILDNRELFAGFCSMSLNVLYCLCLILVWQRYFLFVGFIKMESLLPKVRRWSSDGVLVEIMRLWGHGQVSTFDSGCHTLPTVSTHIPSS